MNRSYELVVMSAVCKRLFQTDIHQILSKAARQKLYRKNIKKADHEDVRKEAIKFLLELNEDEGNMAMAKFVCGVIINRIAPRATNNEPEPDVDNFESAFNGPPPSGQNSGGGPPVQEMIRTPRVQGVGGVFSPSHYLPQSPGQVPLPSGDDEFLA